MDSGKIICGCRKSAVDSRGKFFPRNSLCDSTFKIKD